MLLKLLRELCSHKPWTRSISHLAPSSILPLALSQRLPGTRRGRTWTVPLCPHGRGLKMVAPPRSGSDHIPTYSCRTGIHLLSSKSVPSPHPGLSTCSPSAACSCLSAWKAGLSHFQHAFSWSGQFGKSLRLPSPWPWSLWAPLPRDPDSHRWGRADTWRNA